MIKQFLFTVLIIIFSTVLTAQEAISYSFETKTKYLPFGLTTEVPAIQPEISLVLSGGGARGLSQIGILKAFEENKIKVSAIYGTSMGSIIGGMYSAGYSVEEMTDIVNKAPWNEFYSTEDNKRNELFIDQKITEDKAVFALRLDGFKPILPTSISSGQKVTNFLNLLALNAPLNVYSNFSEFLFDFKAISTNLVTGEMVILEDGSLHKAIRASSSFSLLLPPVEIDTMLLVDGGLVSNIPVNAALKYKPDLVIAVNTTSPLFSKEDLAYPWNVADQMVSIPMQVINKQNEKNADFLIIPNLGSRQNSDFSEISSIIDSGYISAKKIISEIKDKIKGKIFENISGKDSVINELELNYHENSTEYKIIKGLDLSRPIYLSDIYFSAYNLYLSGNYRSFKIRLLPVNGKTLLSVEAPEYPEILTVSVKGSSKLFNHNINACISKLLYKPFNPENVSKEIMNVLRNYRKNGFCLASVDKVTFNEQTKDLLIEISEGVVEQLIIKGNTKSDETLITRDFKVKPGDVFSCKGAEEGLANLRSTNLFEDIDVEIIRIDGKNYLELTVKEKISSVIRFGFAADNEYLSQISIDIRDENLFGSGTELGATYNGSLKKNSLELEQRATRIFNTYLTYRLKGFLKSQDISVYKNDSVSSENRFQRSKDGEYSQSEYGVSFGIGMQVKKIGNLIFEARYQQDQINNTVGNKVDSYRMNISTLGLKLNIDSQNKFPYPTTGFVLNAGYETAQSFFGSNQSYTKFDMRYEQYISISSVSAIHPKIIFGFADATIPLSRQFSFGGQNSFFGFRDYEYRGRQIFISSLEYRYMLPFKLFFDTYLRGRYDLGSIWSQKEEIRLKDLRHGLGIILSLDTPIGPADFSIGKSFLIKNKLKDNIISWGPLYFYFSIGYNY